MFVQAFLGVKFLKWALELVGTPPKWPNEIQYLFHLFEALCFTSLPIGTVEENFTKTSQLTTLDVENWRYTRNRSKKSILALVFPKEIHKEHQLHTILIFIKSLGQHVSVFFSPRFRVTRITSFPPLHHGNLSGPPQMPPHPGNSRPYVRDYYCNQWFPLIRP